VSFSVGLVDLAAFAVADRPGQLVPRLLHGGLGIDRPAVGVIDRVNHRQQMQGLGAVLGERLPERGRVVTDARARLAASE